MSGVYTAQPAASSTPSVPTGWPISWPFPGAYPPGYEPVLSLTLNAQAAMVPGMPVTSVDLTLYDQSTYATAEPPETITYSATRLSDDSVVNLKFDGGASFLPAISKAYLSVGGDFWGDTPDFEFDVTSDDIGDSIVLLVTSSPLGQDEVTQTDNILVVETFTYTVKITNVSSDPTFPVPVLPYDFTWGWAMYITVWDQDAAVGPYCDVYFDREATTPVDLPGYNTVSIVSSTDPESQNGLLDFSVEQSEDDGDEWYAGATEDGTFKINFLRLSEDLLYDVSTRYYDYKFRGGGSSVTFTTTLEVYKNGDLQETAVKARTLEGSTSGGGAEAEEIWCTVSGETGEITIINP